MDLWYNIYMVIEKIKNTILEHGLIERGEHIVLGLSGGPDSVCLFHVLYALRAFFDIRITAVHINHKLRPGAAEEDQQYVEALCRDMAIDCRSYTFDVNRIAKEEKLSGEDAGRKVRYQSFYQVAQEIKEREGVAVKIAVAQNRNDQAETLLMRLMRGTGTDGLAGIDYRRVVPEGWTVIRPLLDVSRAEIEAYCGEQGLNPRMDHTNEEAIYTRNKIRLELLPYMEENFNGQVVEALTRLAAIAREDNDYLYQVADNLALDFAQEGERISIPVEVLTAQHPAIRKRIILRIFKKLGLVNNISARHLAQAEGLLKENRTSSATDFSDGYGMKIVYGRAEFYKKEAGRREGEEWQISLTDILENHALKGPIKAKLLEKNQWAEEMEKREKRLGTDGAEGSYMKVCTLSWDEIEKKGCDLLLRTRREGDYIIPLGMKGRKKLQDFFVDDKIVQEKREVFPLVCIGSEVLWIIGKRINENYKVGEDTGKILLLEYRGQI